MDSFIEYRIQVRKDNGYWRQYYDVCENYKEIIMFLEGIRKDHLTKDFRLQKRYVLHYQTEWSDFYED